MSSGGGVSPIIHANELAHDGSLSVLDDAAKIDINLLFAKSFPSASLAKGKDLAKSAIICTFATD